MILTCPSCGTQYVVKDGAIPAGGRQVRCASCKYSWHQDPEIAEDVEAAAATDMSLAGSSDSDRTEIAADASEPTDHDLQERQSSDGPAPVQDVGTADAFQNDPTSGAAWTAEQDDEFSPFGSRDEVYEEPSRSPFLKLLMILLLVAALAAAFWFLAPAEWKNRLGIAQAGDSPLQLTLTKTLREPLESGNDLVTVSGRIINPTAETQNVPPIHAELRKKTGEVVYTWVISPSARRIPPGGVSAFNRSEVNVPREGEQLTVTLGGTSA